MARVADTYSRFVAWLKILLPLLALGVLGTVFLVTSDNSIESGFTFSEADLDSLESGSFLQKPQINGLTTKGEPFNLVADKISAHPEDTNLVMIENLTGSLVFSSGAWVNLQAETAELDMAAQTLRFDTGGQMETSDGNIAVVQNMLVRLESGEISGQVIDARGPLGHISADTFRIEADAANNRVLWFENNVRMLYELQGKGE